MPIETASLLIALNGESRGVESGQEVMKSEVEDIGKRKKWVNGSEKVRHDDDVTMVQVFPSARGTLRAVEIVKSLFDENT